LFIQTKKYLSHKPLEEVIIETIKVETY
ncbi:MAG: hypothetical protein ACD_51C00289G0001, partial [uncultured bacterium]